MTQKGRSELGAGTGKQNTRTGIFLPPSFCQELGPGRSVDSAAEKVFRVICVFYELDVGELEYRLIAANLSDNKREVL
jgi:hypothetical protein